MHGVRPPPEPGRALNGEPLVECSLGAQPALCGALTVPEDRADPDGSTIDVQVAVIPATGDDPAPDPVFFLDGGPGAAAINGFRGAPGAFPTLHRDRDFVLVDQRGTGGSNRLAVPRAPDTTGLSDAEADAVIAAWLPAALAELDGDPRFYTTAVAMDDLDEVRTALGYDRINLFGVSYGGTAAQYYLRQYGRNARSVVLDGTSLLDAPLFERFAATSQAALDMLIARCEAESACAQAFPDTGTALAEVLAGLDREPFTTSVVDPATGEPIVLDGATFAGNVHIALMSDHIVGQLPRLIHAAHAGDWALVDRAIATEVGKNPPPADQSVMELVILCSEAWAVADPARTEALSAGSYLAEFQVTWTQSWARYCSHMPAGVVPDDDHVPARSDVPVLLIIGGGDPQNAPVNVADAPVHLPNSLTVIAEGHGHVNAFHGCIPSVVTAFIAAGTVDGLDTSCVADLAPPPLLTVP